METKSERLRIHNRTRNSSSIHDWWLRPIQDLYLKTPSISKFNGRNLKISDISLSLSTSLSRKNSKHCLKCKGCSMKNNANIVHHSRPRRIYVVMSTRIFLIKKESRP